MNSDTCLYRIKTVVEVCKCKYGSAVRSGWDRVSRFIVWKILFYAVDLIHIHWTGLEERSSCCE